MRPYGVVVVQPGIIACLSAGVLEQDVVLVEEHAGVVEFSAGASGT